MSMANQVGKEELDEEWVYLILSAREMGITLEEICSFLEKPSSPVHQIK